LNSKIFGAWQAIIEGRNDSRVLNLLLFNNILIDLLNQSAWLAYQMKMSKRFCRQLAQLAFTIFLLEYSGALCPLLETPLDFKQVLNRRSSQISS